MGQHGGVYIWPDTGAGASVTNQTFTQYVELGTPGAFSYPTNSILRLGSPSVANNRNFLGFEPNAGGTDILAISVTTNDHLVFNGVNLQLQSGGTTRVQIKDNQVDLLQPLSFQHIATSSAPLLKDSAASGETVVTAEVGSVLLRRDGAGIEIKESGTGNTGWLTIPAPAYACIYKANDFATTFACDGTFKDVTGWDGQNVTAVGVTVSTANGTLTFGRTGKYRVAMSCTGYVSGGDGDSITVSVQLLNNGVVIPGTLRVYVETATNTGGLFFFALSAIVDGTSGQAIKMQVSGTTEGGATTIAIDYATLHIERIA